MSFVQPIISLTDDYIVIKVPRETVIKTIDTNIFLELLLNQEKAAVVNP